MASTPADGGAGAVETVQQAAAAIVAARSAWQQPWGVAVELVGAQGRWSLLVVPAERPRAFVCMPAGCHPSR